MLNTSKPRYVKDKKNKNFSSSQIPASLVNHSHIRVIHEKENAIYVQFSEDARAEEIFSLYTFFEGKKEFYVSGGGATRPVFLPRAEELFNELPSRKKESPVYICENLSTLITLFLSQGATDVHFNTRELDTEALFRIDGVVHPYGLIEKEHWKRLVVQLKMRADLDVAESRRPQSGCFSLSFEGRSLDVRVSTHPTVYGERIVLRFLGEGIKGRSFEKIGFSSRRSKEIKSALMKRQGVFLITGPTGSGKTTTLYALVDFLQQLGLRSILTLEDPVEYKTPSIVQASVNPAVNFTYANGIKSILRQDPEVLLLGEIRDEETATMAYRAALTGVMVLATVHAGSVRGVVSRLLDLGVSLNQFVDQTVGILNQRLVRTLCACNTVPCETCGGLKYAGRTTLDEFVLMPSYYGKQHTINSLSDFHNWVLNYQGESLLARTWGLLASGKTSFVEVQRVLGPISSFVSKESHEALSCN